MAKFIDFAEVKEEHSILDAAERLGIQLKQRGNQYRGPCPVHDGGDRGLVITPNKGEHGAFYCFKGKKGGRDSIGLVAHVLGISQNEAAHWLGNSTSTVPRKGTSTSSTSPQSAEGEEKPGTRTISPLTHLEFDGIDGIEPEVAKELGVGIARKGLLIRAGGARLAVPIHTRSGDLVAYCGVALKDDQTPRFYFPPGFDPQPYLFNAHRVEEDEVLFVASDPMEAIEAIQNGVANVVSFFGLVTADSLDGLQILMEERSIQSVEFI